MLRLRWSLAPLMLSLTLATACGSEEQSAFQQAQSADTIEAYESFLTSFPENSYANPVNDRLENLYYKAAKESPSTESQHAYLKKFPDGRYAGEIKGEYEKTRYKEVAKADSVKPYQGFLKEFPNGNYTYKVKKMHEAAAYRSKLMLANVSAKESRGKWTISGTVENKGDKAISKVSLLLTGAGGLKAEVDLAGDGKLTAGGDLDWSHTAESVPDGFTSESVKVTVGSVLFEG